MIMRCIYILLVFIFLFTSCEYNQKNHCKTYEYTYNAVDNVNPTWLVDKNHKIVWISNSYEDFFLKPYGFSKYDLLGTSGEKIFGHKSVVYFKKNNNLVLKLKKTLQFEETTFKGIKGISVKSVWYDKDTKEILGVKGEWIPSDFRAHKLKG
jgi:uncharacterized lipoprotein YehR (DUF1307 family)